MYGVSKMKLYILYYHTTPQIKYDFPFIIKYLYIHRYYGKYILVFRIELLKLLWQVSTPARCSTKLEQKVDRCVW